MKKWIRNIFIFILFLCALSSCKENKGLEDHSTQKDENAIITINCDSSIFYGNPIDISYNVLNAEQDAIIWSYSDKDLIKVEGDKLVVLKEVSEDTKVVVYAKLVSNENVKAEKEITIKKKVELKEEITISILCASIVTKDQPIDIEAKIEGTSNKEVTWSYSDASLVEVKNSKLTVLKEVIKDTNVVITATSKEDTTKKASKTILVQAPSIMENNKLRLDFTGYYSKLNGVLDKDFKQKLHTLLETSHVNKVSYKKVWEVLESCDEDPEISDNIICIYTGQSIPKINRSGSANGSIKWNREHLWPKSLGFNSEGAAAHNDCHHLHASEEKINNYRGNLDFSEVKNPIKTDAYQNKWDSTFFEPSDEVKGDIARSILYMVVRYDGDTCNDCILDLEIVNGSANKNDIINNEIGRIGDLATLLKWHYQDPVDENERRRNDKVYSFQGNRNPFIDHEEFVSYLYTSLVGKYTDVSEFSYLI